LVVQEAAQALKHLLRVQRVFTHAQVRELAPVAESTAGGESCRFGALKENIRQSRPDSGLGFQANVLETP